MKSLPMWERGLKHNLINAELIVKTSLPMWERGLKPFLEELSLTDSQVAPHVGAWIETSLRLLPARSGHSRSPCGSVD